jgi:hypothetical protein
MSPRVTSSNISNGAMSASDRFFRPLVSTSRKKKMMLARMTISTLPPRATRGW